MTPMPVQHPRRNRVTPFGTLERSDAQGAMMGNRGDLHGRDGEIVRAWKSKTWLSCVTVGRNGHRVAFDTPGRYTPLFALDEATMLAAGHRPCAQCRRDAFNRFKTAWAQAFDIPGGNALPVTTIDSALHAARLDEVGATRTFAARLGDLPSGAMLTMPTAAEGSPERAFLLWQGHVHPWTHDGYGRPSPAALDAIVDVLTPEPIVSALRAGYVPEVRVR